MIMTDKDLFTLVGCGVAIIILTVVMISKYVNWLPFKVMQVKSSGGKKVLLRKRLPNGNRYFVAKMDDKDGVWNEKAGLLGKDNKGRVTIPQKAFGYEFGCKIVEFDSFGNLYCPDGSIITGFDAKNLQDLLDREAQKPAEENGMEKLKFILAIITFFGLLVVGFLVFKNSQKTDLLIEGFNNLQNVLVNSTVHTV
jgi:hypothetical protein